MYTLPMDDSPYVYHASNTKGLKKIEPQKSTHKQSWVYATKDLATSAMFLGNNFDFICQTGGPVGDPHIFERFAGALEHAYKGRSGVNYKLPAEFFEGGRTQWEAEVISEQAVPVVEEIDVEDALSFLESLEKDGKLRIYRYPNAPEGTPQDKSDIVWRAVAWTIDVGERYLDFTEQYHPDVLSRVIQELRNKNYVPESEKWLKRFRAQP